MTETFFQNDLTETGPAEETETSLDIQQPENALPRVCLEELPVSLQEACARASWQKLMPVQSLAIPYLLKQRDIMIQSRTGSGKTGTYLLPMLPIIDPESKESQALVLVPTRELALQVTREAETVFSGTGVRCVTLYGGVGYQKQLEALQSGSQLVVGTPGRILDHILRRALSLEHLKSLVFDEADRMLSIGFYPDMKELQKHLPQRHVHTSLFSATYPPHVLSLAAEFMDEPSMLSLSQKEVYVASVQHCYCPVKTMDKDRTLVRLIETENPASAIIFCNTKSNVHYVCSVLQGFGYEADELCSDLAQNKREAVMNRLREGKVRFLVATDVAARGIDIPALSHVFLYEPPEDREIYIHRAGRTGRAGAAGTVISLVDIMERMELERIAAYYNLNLVELKDPTPEEVAEASSARLLTMLESRFRSLSGLERLRLQRYRALAKSLAMQDEESEGLSLLAMLLDSCHHLALNANFFPQEQAPAKSRSRKRRKGRGEATAEQEPDEAQSASESPDESPKPGRRKRGRRGRRPEQPQSQQEGEEAQAQEQAPSDATQADQKPSEREGRSRRRRRGRHARKQAQDAPESASEAPAPQPEQDPS